MWTCARFACSHVPIHPGCSPSSPCCCPVPAARIVALLCFLQATPWARVWLRSWCLWCGMGTARCSHPPSTQPNPWPAALPHRQTPPCLPAPPCPPPQLPKPPPLLPPTHPPPAATTPPQVKEAAAAAGTAAAAAAQLQGRAEQLRVLQTWV